METFEKLNQKFTAIAETIVKQHDLQKSYVSLLANTFYKSLKEVFKYSLENDQLESVNRVLHTTNFDFIEDDLYDALKYHFAIELCHKSTISVLLGDHIAQRYFPKIINAINSELYHHCTEKVYEYLGLELHYNKVAHTRSDKMLDVKNEFYENFKQLRVA